MVWGGHVAAAGAGETWQVEAYMSIRTGGVGVGGQFHHMPRWWCHFNFSQAVNSN